VKAADGTFVWWMEEVISSTVKVVVIHWGQAVDSSNTEWVQITSRNTACQLPFLLPCEKNSPPLTTVIFLLNFILLNN